MIAYDEGIMSDDKVLASSLWRRFFERNSEDYVAIEELVKYVRRQVHMLDSMSSQQFMTKPKIHWIPFSKL